LHLSAFPRKKGSVIKGGGDPPLRGGGGATSRLAEPVKRKKPKWGGGVWGVWGLGGGGGCCFLGGCLVGLWVCGWVGLGEEWTMVRGTTFCLQTETRMVAFVPGGVPHPWAGKKINSPGGQKPQQHGGLRNRDVRVQTATARHAGANKKVRRNTVSVVPENRKRRENSGPFLEK